MGWDFNVACQSDDSTVSLSRFIFVVLRRVYVRTFSLQFAEFFAISSLQNSLLSSFEKGGKKGRGNVNSNQFSLYFNSIVSWVRIELNEWIF